MNFNNIKICIAGGDIRMLICARELAERGFEVSFCGFDHGGGDCGAAVKCADFRDAAAGASVIILPVPFSSDGCRVNCPFSRTEIRVDDVLDSVTPGQLLFAGVCTPSFLAKAEEKNITLTDYMKDEVLTVKNAIPTAEGALSIAMRELNVTIHGSDVLIAGYGRVGKVTAELFSALHANVTVCARRYESLAWASASGLQAVHINDICRAVRSKSLIINTVPELILDKNVLSCMDMDPLVIDLASLPGGVDDDAASIRGIKVIHALSLPGKIAPLTAGKNIAEAILRILKRRGVL